MDEPTPQEQQRRDDLDLCAAVRNGLKDAWRHFEARFRPVVTRVVVHMLKPGNGKFSHEDMEDTVEVVMAKLARPGALDDVEKPEGRVVRIAKNTAIDRMRKYNAMEISVADDDVDLRDNQTERHPEHMAEKAVLAEAVRASLNCLTTQELRAIELRVFACRSAEDVAIEMNITQRRVNQLVARAYTRLAEPTKALAVEWELYEAEELENERAV